MFVHMLDMNCELLSEFMSQWYTEMDDPMGD